MMPIALESSRNRIEESVFIGGLSCLSIFESQEPRRPMDGVVTGGDQRFTTSDVRTNAIERGEEELDSRSSNSSSIGRNSDLSGRSSDGEDETEEVQSLFKGPLDTMDALEEVLPIRRGISKFYRGKSKSFTSLSDVSSSSITDIAKSENAYTKKRKNLLACSILVKNQNSPLRSNAGGISKRPTNSSRSTFTLADAMSRHESNSTGENSNSSSPSSSRHLPPLHPQAKVSFNDAMSLPPPQQNFSPRRSFSLTDLQCAETSTNSINNSSISGKDEGKKLY